MAAPIVRFSLVSGARLLDSVGMWAVARRILFYLDPEFAHLLGAVYLRLRGLLTQGRVRQLRWRGKPLPQLAGFSLDSPLGLAAGFDKNAKLVLGLRSLGFGFIEIGTVTPRPQPGNPRPRLFRIPEARALINRMGFNSEGADAVAERLKRLRALHRLDFPLGVNIGKNRATPLERAAEDYVAALERLYPFADYLVVNLSSPNTPGLTSLQEGDSLIPLLEAVRSRRDCMAKKIPGITCPLLLKLSPDLTEAAAKTAVEAAMAAGFQGIIASNTSRRRDFPELAPTAGFLKEQAGGLSGAPLRKDAVAQVAKIRAWLGPKAILVSAGGLGGVEDARERLELGADLLQVYTEFVYSGPRYPRDLLRGLTRA